MSEPIDIDAKHRRWLKVGLSPDEFEALFAELRQVRAERDDFEVRHAFAVGAGTDWRVRAERAEAALERVKSLCQAESSGTRGQRWVRIERVLDQFNDGGEWLTDVRAERAEAERDALAVQVDEYEQAWHMARRDAERAEAALDRVATLCASREASHPDYMIYPQEVRAAMEGPTDES